MEETLESQKRLLKWFSGLPLELNQRVADRISTILREFKGTKTKRGNQCLWIPCGNHEYGHGLCARHYQIIRFLRKTTDEKWSTFCKIGVCLPSHTEFRRAYEASDFVPRKDDPLQILIRKAPKSLPTLKVDI